MRDLRRIGTIAAALAGAALALGGCVPPPALLQAAADDVHADTAIAAVLASPTRSPANVARDEWRHPRETLGFFGVTPSQKLVEIWPGGGWYTEVLAPLLAESGRYTAAGSERQLAAVRAMMAKDPATYGKVALAAFPAAAWPAGPRVPDGSADTVLTFRNVHNWLMAEPPVAAEAFAQMYAMLKPGGTLGVVEHRLPEEAEAARERKSGYVKVSTVRRLAESAGFRLVAASEINANPLDSHDHPDGVWSLPPTFAGGDRDRARFAAIGESDRMTLKFIRPLR